MFFESRPRPFIDLAREILATGEDVEFEARGASMYPTIRDGERVRVRRKADPLRIGDIVLCEVGPRVFAHRIVRFRAEKGGERVMVVRGDALRSSIDQIVGTDVIGRVVAVDRYGEWLDISGGCVAYLAIARRLGRALLMRARKAL